MRYIPLKNRPGIKEDLRRIANRRNVPKNLRLLAVADLRRQLDRLDQVLNPRSGRGSPPEAPGSDRPKLGTGE